MSVDTKQISKDMAFIESLIPMIPVTQAMEIARHAAQIAIDESLHASKLEYATLAQAAKCFGVSPRSLSERIADGRIPENCVVWVADMRRVHMGRLREWIDEGGSGRC